MPTILITGANRGIGLELVRQYSADGWKVHACCREPGKAGDLENLQDNPGGKVTIHRLDVTGRAQVRLFAESLKGEPIDILMNNAGVYGSMEGFGKVDDKIWLYTLKVNTMAPMHVAEALADNVAASSKKLIATMSSKMGSIGDNTSGGYYIYRSSKAAVNIVMKSMALDLRERGITVVTLHPGWVRTDMGGTAAPLTVEQSVTGLRKVLEEVGPADSGRFLGWDGAEVPW
jgi:NAD(P)-dependent dehydrogenase (short-subunit alcohol dehydrogenase family)